MNRAPYITRISDKILLLLAVRKMFGVPTDKSFLSNYFREEIDMNEALESLKVRGLITITRIKKNFYELTDEGIEDQSVRIALLLNNLSL